MNSCFNCLDFGNPRCTSRKYCAKWKPDYPTLEYENAELKQRISELEKASDEFERIANKSMNQQDILIDENDELKDENDELKQELAKTNDENEIIRGTIGMQNTTLQAYEEDEKVLKQKLEVYKKALKKMASEFGTCPNVKNGEPRRCIGSNIDCANHITEYFINEALKELAK